MACQASRMPGPQPSLILALRTEPARRASWEPEMGANVFRPPQTQRDVARIFSQVKGSPLDSVRR